MTSRVSALRNASARIEALETRSLMSGEIDHSFATDYRNGGNLIMSYSGSSAAVNRPALPAVATGASNGRFVVYGVNSGGKNPSAFVTEYNSDGTVNRAFGSEGSRAITGLDPTRLDGAELLPDGRVLVVGPTAFRLTADGQLDTAFGGGDGRANSLLAADRRASGPNAVAFTSDGGYLELSTVSKGNAYVVKYKADGSVDKSFGTSGLFNLASLNTAGSGVFMIGGVTVDAKNRVYVSYEANDSTVGVFRLTAAGKIDTTYGKAGIANAGKDQGFVGGPIAVLTDGRVVASVTAPTDDAPPTDLFGFDASGTTRIVVGSTDKTFFINRLVAGKDKHAVRRRHVQSRRELPRLRRRRLCRRRTPHEHAFARSHLQRRWRRHRRLQPRQFVRRPRLGPPARRQPATRRRRHERPAPTSSRSRARPCGSRSIPT